MYGKNSEPVVIVDADAIISFVYVGDENHPRAKATMQQLAIYQSSLLFPTTAICEAVTVLRGKLHRPEDASRSALKQLVRTFFDNSPGSAAAALLDMTGEPSKVREW